MLIDLSGIYSQDIRTGDILYHISNDTFYKIIRIEGDGDWIILYTDKEEFSWALDKTERLDKDDFKLFRRREMGYYEE